MREVFVLAVSYLLGSLPFGLIMGFAVKRIDIRQHGSGNIGATNVARILGKPWGIGVFVLDFVKGMVAPLLVSSFLPKAYSYVYAAAAILAVCGHNWPVFLKFKGGKGVATSVGAISGLSLIYHELGIALLAAILTWVVVFFVMCLWRR